MREEAIVLEESADALPVLRGGREVEAIIGGTSQVGTTVSGDVPLVPGHLNEPRRGGVPGLRCISVQAPMMRLREDEHRVRDVARKVVDPPPRLEELAIRKGPFPAPLGPLAAVVETAEDEPSLATVNRGPEVVPSRHLRGVGRLAVEGLSFLVGITVHLRGAGPGRKPSKDRGQPVPLLVLGSARVRPVEAGHECQKGFVGWLTSA